MDGGSVIVLLSLGFPPCAGRKWLEGSKFMLDPALCSSISRNPQRASLHLNARQFRLLCPFKPESRADPILGFKHAI